MAEDTTTRYERVKNILNEAAGESAADYDGFGRFWKLPLEQLLSLEIFGVRMISEEKESLQSSCCGHESGQRPDEEEGCNTRGATSGLVKGLRGEAPFDGSRFPRLPWGGRPVAKEDIQFISDWIDDGCPLDDRVVIYGLQGLEATPALEHIKAGQRIEVVAERAYRVFTGSPNAYKYKHGELKQRVNIDCMSNLQLDRLRKAFRTLYSLNKWPEDSRNYNNLALIHQNHCQHGWERFLPWHRIYMYEFEQALQDQFPDVTMPYWDWTMPQYFPSRPEKGWIIPKALQAFLTSASVDELSTQLKLNKAKKKNLQKLVGVHFASQARFFADVTRLIGAEYTGGDNRIAFIDKLLADNALWYPLRYPGEYMSNGSPSTINKVIHYHYPTAEDIQQIVSLRTFRDFGGGSLYNDSFGFLDQNPHNTMHIWTGGMNPNFRQDRKDRKDFVKDLGYDRNRGVKVAGRQFHTREDMYSEPQYGDMFSNLTAAYDPIFWPVHANVDRLWWEWQQCHPHSLPGDLDPVLTPWSYTIADTLDMYRFGYEYVKSAYIIPVGLDAPVGRFVSQPIDIPEPVRNNFSYAEVRLHRVPQLPRSCFIRVFLNQPRASAATSIRDPHYAGYLAIFGHGPCYGGPGHCDVPPLQARKYDLRPRSHNTPRNHRINITDCTRKLLEKGAETLRITLVVIGVDYQEDPDLLRLEGVSLNFLD